MNTCAKLALVAAVACMGLAPAGAFAAPQPPAAAKAKYSSSTTPLAELIKNPQTKAIVAKAIGPLMDQVEANIDMIPPDFTLQSLAEYAGGALSPEALKQIDVELAKL
jgi:hypothetical protein